MPCNTLMVHAHTVVSMLLPRFQAFSFLCTFVPGSEKSTERTFAPVELLFHGTFAPWNFRSSGAKLGTFVPWNIRSRGTFVPRERRFQELSFRGTFAPVELSKVPGVRKLHEMKVLGLFALRERTFHGTKVPLERKFSLWTFRSRERKCRGTKRPDTFSLTVSVFKHKFVMY